MAANDIADLLIRIDATTESLRREMKRAEGTVNKSTSSMDKLLKRLDDRFHRMGDAARKAGKIAAGAMVGASAALAALTKSGLSAVDSLAKTSARLGVATEDLASLRFAAQQTGVAVQTFDMGLQRMTRRVAEAAQGTGEAQGALKELGLSAQELVALSPDEMFRRVTDAMQGVGNQADRVRLSMKLFDSEGVALVQTMEGGVAALDRFASEAEVAGLAISQIDAGRVEAANDAMNRVFMMFQGFSQQLAIKLAPALEAVADQLFGVAKEAGGVGEIASDAFSFMVTAAGRVADAIRGISVVMKAIGVGLRSFVSLWLQTFDTIAQGAAWLANKIPGINIDYHATDFAKFVDEFQDETAKAFSDLHDAAMEPMPSDAIDAWVANAVRQFDNVGWAFEAAQKRHERASALIAQTHAELDAMVSESTETVTKAAETNADGLQAAYDRGLERLDDTFAGFFKDILRNGKVSFDGLKNLFLDTIAEMAYAAARSRILIGVGVSSGSAGASAAGGGAAGGGGFLSSLGSGISGFGAGAANLVGQGLFQAGAATGSQTLVGLSGRAFNTANNMTLGTALGGAAAGFAGSYLGTQVFGETSGIGSGLGGTIGFALGGPLGAALGSFAGSGLESLLGGDNNGDNPGRARVNLGTGAINVGGVGNTFDQANVDQVQAAADFAQQVAAAIGGSSANLDITAGRDGLRVGGRNFGQDSAAFIDRIFDNVVNQADGLSGSMKRLLTSFRGTSQQALQFAQAMGSIDRLASVNPVRRVAEDIARAQDTALGVYRSQMDQISTLVENFDGSAAAAQELNSALTQNQQAAYQLAAAIAQISDQVDSMFMSSARQIRESVMSPGELFASRKAERDTLRRSLNSLTDPEEIARVAGQINQLNNQLFSSLEAPGERQAEVFARYAEATNKQAQRRLDRILADLEKSQDRQNRALQAMMQETAERQQRAADTMLSAAQTLSAAAADFRSGGEVVS
jgi:RecA/RadA recombinase